ncbi:uncharacterized protein [Amphiura filiformis]|uniref:uncharacterized protein n=1 Tax=Amphiura filiformis TaxID=82378 RepID=UPI003B216F9F
MYTYSREALLNIRNTSVHVRSRNNFEPNVWKLMKELKIAKTTRRGCRSGKSKLRQIKTRITARLPPTNVTNVSGVCHANLTKFPKAVYEPKACSLPNVYMCNPRSLNNKFDEFSTMVRDLGVDIAGVSESWFTSDKPVEYFQIQDYNLITNNRTWRRGGGVAIYARENLGVQEVHDINVPDHLEVLWVKARPERLPREIPVLFYAIIYSPPDNPHESELIAHLLHGFDYIRTQYPQAGVTLFGDINRLDTTQICSGNGLTQVVNKPTRKDAILDKIITTMNRYYKEPEIYSPVGTSDHSSVLWTPLNSLPSKANTTRSRVVRPMKDSNMREFGIWIGERNWSEVYEKTSAVEKCNAFYTTLQEGIDRYFPIKTMKVHSADKPWMTSYIKRLIDERQQVFHREHRSRKWKRLRNKISREIAKAKKEHYKTRVQRHKKANPAEWYKQIKVMANLSNSESTIQPPPGVDANDFEAVANSINNIFASVSNDLDVLDTAKLPAYRPDPNPCPTVHDYEVYEMLKKIKIGKAGGPDGISARLIREFSYELSKPLAEILNQSYFEGSVPPQWKRAVVVPIPKSKPATWDKLRPVSLTDHFAKVAEGFGKVVVRGLREIYRSQSIREPQRCFHHTLSGEINGYSDHEF